MLYLLLDSKVRRTNSTEKDKDYKIQFNMPFCYVFIGRRGKCFGRPNSFLLPNTSCSLTLRYALRSNAGEIKSVNPIKRGGGKRTKYRINILVRLILSKAD